MQKNVYEHLSTLNIHPHPGAVYGGFWKQGWYPPSFLIPPLRTKIEFYYLRHQKLMEFWNRMETGGRKSFRYEEFRKDFFLKRKERGS